MESLINYLADFSFCLFIMCAIFTPIAIICASLEYACKHCNAIDNIFAKWVALVCGAKDYKEFKQYEGK